MPLKGIGVQRCTPAQYEYLFIIMNLDGFEGNFPITNYAY
ncbi:hypothetical protein CHCC14600_2189 [Bacillus licheniformis]|nr:hypothetical protein B4090_1658 [Bacillus licheniformis]TWN17195.1 hypothetical protein CHCC14564_1760 [Bacillus licheniformis LMG 17339]KYC85716.1 hypothetical protein B4091_1693 [Bacillus licheniformis]TWJ94152.1 hypothetical protein CHCC20495_2149 [Bacillus licheniformis]TWJ98901.1 hypothetical protein CHCC20487_2137 [Bacillus licheniformis]